MRYLFSRFFSLSGFALLFAAVALFAMSDIMVAQADGATGLEEPALIGGAEPTPPAAVSPSYNSNVAAAAESGAGEALPWLWISLAAIIFLSGVVYMLRRPTAAYG